MRSALVLLAVIAGCRESPPPSVPAPMPSIADRAWLAQHLFEGAQAEQAVYDGWIEDEGGRRTFEATTRLEQDESTVTWTLLLDGESYAARFARADAAPRNVSANRFDGRSNRYRELTFLPAWEVRVLARGGSEADTDRKIPLQRLTYPAVAVPFLVRFVDFSRLRQVDFTVLMMDGTYVDAMVELVGRADDAEEIVVHYAHAVESTLGARATKEIYRRKTDPARSLLQMQEESGRYGLSLRVPER